MANKKLMVVLGADTSGFNKAMDSVKSSTKSATDSAKQGFDSVGAGGEKGAGKIKSAFGTVAKVVATAFAVDKVIGFGKSVVEQSASAQAMEAQFEQVFGNMQGNATNMITSMSGEFNMLPNRVKPVFTSLSSMFMGVGMDSETAMKVAQDATMASADAAAFYDTSMESASSSVKSFMKGNYEAGESIGLFANDTQMATFAINSGLVETSAEWKNLDEATKMATRAEYVRSMQEQSGAMGQASREGSGYENVMGNLSQAWADFQSALGKDLLPAVVGVVEKLTEGLQNVDVDTILDGFSTFGGYLEDVFTPVFETVKEVVSEVWETFKDVGGIEMAQEALDKVEKALNFVRDNAEQLTPILAGLLGGFLAFQTITTVVGIINSIKTAITGLKTATSLANAVQLIFNGTLLANPFTWVAIAIGVLIAAIVAIWTNWDSVSQFLSESWASIKEVATEVFEGLGQFFVETWEGIKTNVSEAWSNIKQFFSDTWEGIKSNAIEIFESIKQFFSDIWESIKTTISEKVESIKTKTFKVFTSIKTFISDIWNNIKKAISDKVESIKTKVSDIWENIKTKTSNIFNGIKTTLSSIWEGIKSTISEKIQSIKTKVSEIWESIKTKTSEVFNGIKTTATGIWNDVKSAITKPIESAKKKVKEIIDDIKGFFSGMKLKLPEISMPKLPHFSLSGSFSLKPPSVPKLSVSWYETGGIATGASVVGIGENGDEAILPLSNKKRMKPFASAVASMMDPKGNTGSLAEGDVIITGNSFTIREEADIKKVAQELYKLQKREGKGKGR